ncbi:Cytochrome oxidase Cu insertion factor, SCO1/SenC/PrrC family [Paraburkholderia sartisoli]|uniref:Cytochrome oxidase Cu insertion factor, SCO1/SenC/PrrC family n=1 Tax=Paraburkholderia sartisoli TaxID=83784 RepID=A0A1H3Y6I3_9BURK|nr:cytochrome C oxidase subunit I [Paraburkholderia sartisoli]SEA07279.1 Cytochrome oxidase Cu insertion factor, SCO1/SenC/PrrC family [Paraburkholderia sartisoli]
MSTQSPRSPQSGKAAQRGQPASKDASNGTPPARRGSWQRGRWMMLLIAFICAAPVIASYITYYVIKPKGGTTSYGTLVEPQRPIPDSLTVIGEDGKPMPLTSLRGRWLLVSVDGSACDKACVTKLYFMRQIRATQGGERERVVNVWLRTDSSAVPDVVKHAYDDTDMLIADPSAVAAWLPVDSGTKLTDHIFVVDPNGNLMMRFPKDPDPSKIRSDVTKLLKWSSIG